MKCSELKLVEFLTDDLLPEETEQVLGHLDICSDCRDRLQVMAALRAGSSAFETRQPQASAPKTHPHRILSFLTAAAALLLLAVFPFLYRAWQGNDDPGNSRIAELATNQPYVLFPLLTRSPDSREEEAERYDLALQLYGEGRFQEALRLFEKLPSSAEALFYQGVCNYLLGNDTESLDAFRGATERDSRWHRPALWYQANLFLRRGELDEARNLLELLRQEPGEFGSEAEALLNQLRSIK